MNKKLQTTLRFFQVPAVEMTAAMTRRYVLTSTILMILASILTASIYAQDKTLQRISFVDNQAQSVIRRAIEAHNKITSYNVEIDRTDYPLHNQASLQRVRLSVEYFTPGKWWRQYFDLAPNHNVRVMVGDGQSRFFFETRQPEFIDTSDVSFEAELAARGHLIALRDLSPLAEMAKELPIDAKAASASYKGHEMVNGILCDVVEGIRGDLNSTESQSTKSVFYIGLNDGLLRKIVSVSTTRQGQMRHEEEILFKPISSAKEPTFDRFKVAVTDLLAGRRFPSIPDRPDVPGLPLRAINAFRLDGKALNWEDFRGHVLVIVNWATWCSVCHPAMTIYEKVRQALEDQGVEFVWVSWDQKAADYEQWIKENRNKYGFIFAHAEAPNWNDALRAFGPGVPGFYIVDRDGRIVASYAGFGAYSDEENDARLAVALQKAGIILKNVPGKPAGQ